MNLKSSFQVSHLCCTRRNKALFEQLSFCLSPGEMLLVTGNNGSGKSTLLRLLAGLITPISGQILWNNQLIKQVHEEFVTNMHYLGHTNGLKLDLTVDENLRLSTKIHPGSAPDTMQIIRATHLTELQTSFIKDLSAGQKRRVALARLILLPKQLWIIDEPLTALDTNTQQLFLSQLETHLTHGGMCIMSSHHPLPLSAQQTLRLGQ